MVHKTAAATAGIATGDHDGLTLRFGDIELWL
jgi:hypothetical protein